MRIGVFGAGGVGGYFGGRLAQAGEEVVFIARGEHLRAMQAKGLQVKSPKGDFTIGPLQATDDPARAGVVDVVLVCVKAWQVPEAAAAMQPMVGPETIVVPLENGVDAPAQLAAILDAPGEPRHVMGGVCHISSFVAEPGQIHHVGIEPRVAFGSLDGQAHPLLERLRQAFERAGVTVQISPDIRIAMWTKFTFIAALSGVGAVTRTPAGVIRSVPEVRRMLEAAIGEVVAVGRAHKVALPEDLPAQTLAFIDSLPESTLASMQRDIIEGRPSELAAQNGAVVRLGLERGVPTPVHAFIYHALLPQELRARGELHF